MPINRGFLEQKSRMTAQNAAIPSHFGDISRRARRVFMSSLARLRASVAALILELMRQISLKVRVHDQLISRSFSFMLTPRAAHLFLLSPRCFT